MNRVRDIELTVGDISVMWAQGADWLAELYSRQNYCQAFWDALQFLLQS